MYTYIYLYIPTLNTSPAAVQSYCSNLTAAVHSNRMLLRCSSADMQFALCRLYYTVLQNRNDVQSLSYFKQKESHFLHCSGMAAHC